MNKLDPSKLTSVDQHGDRIRIIPAEVKGFFRKHRTWTQLVLLVIFLVLPWTKLNGHQTILLNIPDRQFALFGIVFRAHDTPLLFFILAFAALGLAFVTSVWGRVWCGWACPQTVFIDGVFRRIELWVEGNYRERRRLRDGPLTTEKLIKYTIKWILFILVSSFIAHSFMAYFIGAEELIAMMQRPPSENQSYFFLVVAVTAAVAFDFGWFREQFCVIMCPYGRIQSLLLDQKSLAIVYDVARGEPRKGSLAKESASASRPLINYQAATSLQTSKKEKEGDCVACNRCVQVCPTGIDIRNGLQMECIACTACADACDEIMTKVQKPTGLIGYKTLDSSPISLKKPRSVIYIMSLLILAGGLSYAISTRQPFHAALLRNKATPFSLIQNSDGSRTVLNQFQLHIQNQSPESTTYKMSVAFDSDVELSVAEPNLILKPGESRHWYFFTRVKLEDLKNGPIQGTLKVKAQNSTGEYTSDRELILLGPQQ